jgi:acyl carrier protein
MSASDALDALEPLLSESTSYPVMIGEIDFAAAATFLPVLRGPRFQNVAPQIEVRDGGDQLQRDLASAGSEDEAAVIVEDLLAEIFAHVLQTTADRVDRGRRLDQLGVDSLMAAEIGTRIQQRFGCNVPTVEITSAQGLAPLARRVLGRLRAGSAATGE